MLGKIKLFQFKEKLELRGYSKRSVDDYVYITGLFFKYVSDNESIDDINNITIEHINTYHSYLMFNKSKKIKDSLSLSTVRNHLQALRCFYSVMHSEKLVKDDLSHLITLPKKKKHLPRNVPSQSEVISLLDSITDISPIGIRDRALLELLYASGLRSEEIRSSIIDNLDLQEKTLLVTGKGSKDRIVPLGEWVVRYLVNYLESSRPLLINSQKPTDLIFVSKNGNKITEGNLCHLIKKYCSKIGLDVNITPHSFRHACATHLLKGGADIRWVQELLGHSDLSSTQIYTKIDISYLKKEHEKYHPRDKH